MRLYYIPGACSLADHIALEWIGEPYQAIRVGREELRSESYLRVNPLATVPTLDIGEDEALTQNAAILNYLADRYPQSGLGGDGTPRSRAEVNRWLAFCNADIHPWFKPLFVPVRFHPDIVQHETLKEQARQQLRRLFQRADDRLQGRQWLAGGRSIADPYLFVLLRWAKGWHLEPAGVDLSGCAQLERFLTTMLADSGVRKVLREEGLPAPTHYT